MGKYRKRPVVIEAMQWDGTEACLHELLPWLGDLPRAPDDPHIHPGVGYTPALGLLNIPTLEGTMTANPGDWIIRGVHDELYPCKPDIFAETYEPVEDRDE